VVHKDAESCFIVHSSSICKLLLDMDESSRAQQAWKWIKLAGVFIVVLLCVLLILYVISLLFGVKLMALLKVLAVPITVGAAVPLLNWLQKKRELEVGNQRGQDEALQAYLDHIGNMLLDKDRPLRSSKEGDEKIDAQVRMLARARTLTVLSKLHGERKASVLGFLHESGLITKDRVVLNLSEADLSGADLSRVAADSMSGGPRFLTNLSWADLSGANLSGADLRFSIVREARLSSADLREARLRGSDLSGVDLSGANLCGADIYSARLDGVILTGTDLSEADLRSADLSGAKLTGAMLRTSSFGRPWEMWRLYYFYVRGPVLSSANLRGADLSFAQGVTNERLAQQASSLEGATMPDGQKYEDWLKSKGKGEK